MTAATTCHISQVKFVSVYVDDTERALEFWRDTIGMDVKTDVTMGDFRWIEVAPPGGATRIVVHKRSENSPTFQAASPQFGLVATDIRAAYETWTAAGVKIHAEPKAEPWGRYFLFDDLDGNTFIITSADDD